MSAGWVAALFGAGAVTLALGGYRSTPAKVVAQRHATPEDIRRLLPGEWQLTFSPGTRLDKVKFFLEETGEFSFSERWWSGEFRGGSGQWRLEDSDGGIYLSQSYRSGAQTNRLRLHLTRIAESTFSYFAGDGVERIANRVVLREPRAVPKPTGTANQTNSLQ